jgi:hypothetical protein
MSIIIGSDDLKSKSQKNWNFEISNGLLGIERDTFLLLIAYIYL